MHYNNKVMQDIMRTAYHITADIYEQMAESCSDNATFGWDCIELENGFAVIFASKNGRPYNVEVLDEDDNTVASDFDIKRFRAFVA